MVRNYHLKLDEQTWVPSLHPERKYIWIYINHKSEQFCAVEFSSEIKLDDIVDILKVCLFSLDRTKIVFTHLTNPQQLVKQLYPGAHILYRYLPQLQRELTGNLTSVPIYRNRQQVYTLLVPIDPTVDDLKISLHDMNPHIRIGRIWFILDNGEWTLTGDLSNVEP